jgi:hypothetical protein
MRVQFILKERHTCWGEDTCPPIATLSSGLYNSASLTQWMLTLSKLGGLPHHG